ncbi:MAG: hypothetical protein E7813_11510 [Bradyrhizobium sp.]|nr:MAG: hypothetical protein E7813_11510 [Bradyrhizobium sp.]
MRLNIKNSMTHRLVQELSKRTRESMTAAVTTAVRERLDRVRREQGGSLAHTRNCSDARAIIATKFFTESRGMTYGEKEKAKTHCQ